MRSPCRCLLAAVLLNMLGIVHAQEAKPTPVTKTAPEDQRTVFFELGGNGVYWSMNWEYTSYQSSAFAVHVRLGAGLWHVQPSGGFISVPLALGFSVGDMIRFEAMAGATPYLITGKESSAGDVLFPTFYGGLRYQRPNGGLFLRLGIMGAPLNSDLYRNYDDKWGYNPGFSIGVTK